MTSVKGRGAGVRCLPDLAVKFAAADCKRRWMLMLMMLLQQSLILMQKCKKKMTAQTTRMMTGTKEN